MSNLVSKEVAKKLQTWGYNGNVYEGHKFYYYEREETIFDNLDQTGVFDESILTSEYFVLAPTVSEALDFIREEKGIACCVFYNNELFGDLDNAKAIYYFKYGCNGKVIYNSCNVDYKSFDTHPLAESELLESVIKYIEENEKDCH